jgi:hypothetical protein
MIAGHAYTSSPTGRAVACALVGLLVLGARIAQAAYAFTYESTTLLERGAAGKSLPVAVTYDARSGELCVSDSRQGSIHLLGAGDIEVFRTSHLAGMASPWDGSVDQAGRVVYAERGIEARGTLRRLNVFGEPDGFTAAMPDSLWNPQHVIVTRDGNYLSLDAQSGLLAKHDAGTGALIWQRYCTLDGVVGENLGRPAEAPDGRLYVPGGDLRAVLVLSADGEFLAAFGRFGSAPGRMVLPVGVTFGPAGEVLVLDRLRAKILLFSTTHEFVTEFGNMGFRPGQLYHPVALAATPDGRIYVAQGFQGRVQVFRLARGGDNS